MNDLITLLSNFELTGNSLLIEDLEIAPQEEKTESGILLTDKVDNSIALKKALVLKAGRGYINYQGIFIKNPIEEGIVTSQSCPCSISHHITHQSSTHNVKQQPYSYVKQKQKKRAKKRNNSNPRAEHHDQKWQSM